MREVRSCPACGGDDLQPVLRWDAVPTHSCLLVADQPAALDFPRDDLELVACRSCGFLFNRLHDPEHVAYSADYEETQGFSPVFQRFIADLAHDWVERRDLRGSTVVEIGCGKGEFLTELVRAGVGRATGVDPGLHPERLPADVRERTTCVQGFFPADQPELAGRAVVCRHTLEHVADVGRFLDDVREALVEPDAVLLFELPDVLRVLREGAFWDVYYEHCSYFSAGSLARLFRSHGFDVLDLRRAYDGQYLLLEARALEPGRAATPPGPLEDDLDEVLAAARDFAHSVEHLVGAWRERLRRASDAGTAVVLWGSGSKAVAFLAALGKDAEHVGAVVDINPYKQGRWVAGSGHRILAPDELTDLRPGLVIAMNPAYTGEIRADLAARGLDPELVAV